MTTPTRARRHGSPVEHLLDPAAEAPTTRCGQDARLMARYAPADLPSGERARPLHEGCRKAAQA